MTEFFISPPFGNYLDLKQTISIKGSFTLHPRNASNCGTGLITQAITTIRYNSTFKGWVNRMGLRNKGIDYAIQKYKDTDHVISVAILNVDEIPILNHKIPKDMNLELNVSCPNIKDGEKSERSKKQTELINDRLYIFLNDKRKWCIIKLSPYVDEKLFDKYYRQGFRQFHCSNTIPITEGGLSGPEVKKANSFLIPAIRKKYPDVEIIGGGGIQSLEDIIEYRNYGANHFSFSTVFFSPLKAYKLYNKINFYRIFIE